MLARKELKPLENRIFSLLASLERDGMIEKSKGSINRLVRAGDRAGTRKALKALAERELIKIGTGRFKLLPPKSDLWVLRKNSAANNKTNKAKQQSQAEIVPAPVDAGLTLEIQKEIKDRFIDPDARFVAPMVDIIARFFKSTGLQGKDSNRETENILRHFIKHHLQHRLTMTTLYLSYNIQAEWAEKITSKYDPARTKEPARYLVGCIDRLDAGGN